MQTQCSLKLSALLTGIGNVPNEYDVSLTGIGLDSRAIKQGDLFISIAASPDDAARYERQAIEQGAAVILKEGIGTNTFAVSRVGNVVFVAISALKAQVGELASKFFGRPSRELSVIGVTGTNGKTSVSCFLSEQLGAKGLKTAVIGTLGYGFICDGYDSLVKTSYTTPDVVTVHGCLAELRDQGAECIVMEVSSHALDQGRVDGVEFTGAVFTNLTRDHLDYHETMEEYGSVKARLFQAAGLKFAVVNLDDSAASVMTGCLAENARLSTYSQKQGAADISVTHADFSKGIAALVDTPTGAIEVESNLVGKFNLSNVLAVVGVMVELRNKLAKFDGIRIVSNVPGRMELISQEDKPQAVVDYAHTPDALENVLTAVKPHCTGKLSVVFGCGGDRDKGKRPEMAKVAELHSDHVYVTDDNPRTENADSIVTDILEGFSESSNANVEHDRRKAINLAIHSSDKADWVVVAGKGHEAWQEVAGDRIPFDDREVVREALQQWRASA